ncbi:MAG: hypothetical protein HY980_03810, partial [Candidatus Magasanikbacteria bacterium]|nr:hypothetical protein [Candidatus Magasanikbacteria bacterium]
LLAPFLALSGIFFAYAATGTSALSLTVEAGMSFSVSTNNFATNLTPGTPIWATSTLSVTTGSDDGWNVTMYGNNKTNSVNVLINGANQIPDPTNQWTVTAGQATTTGGNAATITSGVDYLYFRVMSASGTAAFRSTGWWGTDDTPFTNAKWAGIASTTNASRIGNSSVSSGGSAAINTVLYYVDVDVSQAQLTYTGTITFTALPN